MIGSNLEHLPPSSESKSGWPWTEESKLSPPVMPDGKPWPKISIVTPSFNQGQYLEETIRSVLLQNYPNLEYIIIDGGSTDNSVEIIKKYEPWLAYWVSEPDKGQSDAINKGIERCTGEIFNWICSDDFLEANALCEIAENLRDSDKDVFCGVARLLYCDNSVNYASTPLFSSVEKMIYFAQICQPATFFKFDIINQLGYTNSSLHYCMDAEWWVKYLLLNGNVGIAKSDTVLVNYRYQEASKTVSQPHLFDDDFNAIRHSVLKLLEAPKFISKYYLSTKIFDIDILSDIPLIHKSVHRRKLLSFYTRKSIKESYLRHEFTNLISNLIYDVYLKRFKFLYYFKEL